MIEKRVEPRITSVKLPANLQKVSVRISSSVSFKAIVTDTGKVGMGLIVDDEYRKFLNVGKKIILIILPEKITINGEVIYSNKIDTNSKEFRCGVYFYKPKQLKEYHEILTKLNKK